MCNTTNHFRSGLLARYTPLLAIGALLAFSPAAEAQVVIIDNDGGVIDDFGSGIGGSFSSTGFTGVAGGVGAGFFSNANDFGTIDGVDGDSGSANTASPTDAVASYTFTGLPSGTYNVYTFWRSQGGGSNNRTDDALYTVSGFGGADQTANINQRVEPTADIILQDTNNVAGGPAPGEGTDGLNFNFQEIFTLVDVTSGTLTIDIGDNNGAGPPAQFAVSDAVAIQFAPDRIPGDVNNSGTVDLTDFELIRDNFGNDFVLPLQGDLNLDGEADFLDFIEWENNFDGVSPGVAGLLAANAVPEPGSALILLLGAACTACRRSRS